MKTLLKFLLSFIFLSCQEQNQKISKEVAVQNHIKANFSAYQKVYVEIDSFISNSSKSGIVGYAEKLVLGYQVDSLILFNKDKNKLFTTVNTSSRRYVYASSDLVQSLYGVKIDGKWHVYLGENLIAMRDGYKNDKYEPFTWEELSYVAHEQMFGRFISFENNRLIIHEDHIDKVIVPSYWGSTFNYKEKTEEEKFLRLWKESQSKIIDSLQYQQLLDEVNNPSPKEREPIRKITWWDKLWGAKEPVFETKEWKEYIMNKNS